MGEIALGINIPSKKGEEFAQGPEKLGLDPKVPQNLWGSAEPFFNWLYTKRSAEGPPSFEDQLFLLPQNAESSSHRPAFVVPQFESCDWRVHSCSIRSTWNCGMACES